MDVGIATWQVLASTALAYQSTRTSDPRQCWLAEQLTDYLKELRLMDPERLTVEHVLALTYGDQAEDALAMLMRIADQHVHRRWAGERTEHGTIHNKNPGRTSYQNYATPQTGDRWIPDGCWLEWRCAPTGYTGVEPTMFQAGMSCPPRGYQTLRPRFDEWLDRRLGSGFSEWIDPPARLMRVAPLGLVLALGSLDAQAERLADWVIEAFERITAVEEQPGLSGRSRWLRSQRRSRRTD